MKPVVPSKASATPTSLPTKRKVPFLVRGALVLFAAFIGMTTLWLVITILYMFIPEKTIEPPSTDIVGNLVPTLAVVVPTPIVYPANDNAYDFQTAGPNNLPTPTSAPIGGLAMAADSYPVELLPTTTPILATAEPPPTIPPLDPPQRVSVNGVPWEVIVVMPDNVIARSREIFLAGQAMGRNPRAFSKVGDSTVENPHFLARFDTGPYNLGEYAYLQPAIDHFLGSHGRDSVAVRIGLHSWTANDPAWADPGVCQPNETPVQCEIRLNNPSILLIRLGTNDVGVPSMFDGNVRQIVETAIANGVLPVIGTKGDRHEGSNENNDILRRIAADYQIPLWDYDQVANTLPGRGLDVDFAHMNTFYAHDYTDPTAFTRGHAMHNLTALMALDAIWRLVMQE